MPAWDSLDARQKELYARMAEIYAAFLAYDDYNIGRVIEAVKQEGLSDNTLIIFIEGDNGGSAEGTLQGTANEVASSATAPPKVSITFTPSRTSLAVRSTTTTCRWSGRGHSIRRSNGPNATRPISVAPATAWS